MDESRGSLTIAQKVVEKVAVIAAGEADGVARIGSAVERVIGRSYPKADAQMAGDRTRIAVEIAVTWPAALAPVAQAVRSSVHDRVESLLGLTVDAVDVTASRVVRPQPGTTRRVQ